MNKSSSRAWYLAQSSRGEQLWASGDVGEAVAIFQEILDQLGDSASYERCLTLNRLGRCFRSMGRPTQAEESYRNALTVMDKLEQAEHVKRHRSVLKSDLADVLADTGRYEEARAVYQSALAVAKELDDLRQEAVVNGQLGTLALLEGDPKEALRRYRENLQLFQRLHEPAMEAVGWHQLGVVFQQAGQWDEAERCYRESARIWEGQGNLVRAAETWYNLARLNQSTGRFQAAEDWYRKAQKTRQHLGDLFGSAETLHSLAELLQDQPNRLDEARQLAEESVAIQQTLETGTAQIWKIYTVLAQICDKQNQSGRARAYRRQARTAYRNFAGSRHELQQYTWLINEVVATVFQPQRLPELESGLASAEQKGWTDLAAAIRHILNGERDDATLCDTLDLEDSMIVEAILESIKDPGNLKAPLESQKKPVQKRPQKESENPPAKSGKRPRRSRSK